MTRQYVITGAGGAVFVSDTGYRNEVVAGVFLGESAPISGTLAVTETGADTCAAAGKVKVSGTLAASETGADTCTAAGKIKISGVLAATETGADTLAATGAVKISGVFAASEMGADTLAGTGAIKISGSMAAVETGFDTLAGAGHITGFTYCLAETQQWLTQMESAATQLTIFTTEAACVCQS